MIPCSLLWLKDLSLNLLHMKTHSATDAAAAAALSCCLLQVHFLTKKIQYILFVFNLDTRTSRVKNSARSRATVLIFFSKNYDLI